MLERLIGNFQFYFPNQKLIVYDIGLGKSSAKRVRSFCNVEYRKFDFEKYPDHVRTLVQFRWKSLILGVK